MIDGQSLRNILRLQSTCVTIATTLNPLDGRAYGLTGGSFGAVSLEPPLVMFCLQKTSRMNAIFRNSKTFTANILQLEQKEISSIFSKPGLGSAKFDGIKYTTGINGCPLLEDSLAYFECEIWNIYEGGDHDIIVGKVITARENVIKPPLLYYKGNYTSCEN